MYIFNFGAECGRWPTDSCADRVTQPIERCGIVVLWSMDKHVFRFVLDDDVSVEVSASPGTREEPFERINMLISRKLRSDNKIVLSI